MNSDADMTIPGTRVPVGRVGLGCMRLSLDGRPKRAEAKTVIRRALDRGITLFDTADVYARDDSDLGHNEGLIAEVLREAAVSFTGGEGEVLVATKGGRRRPDGAWTVDARPSRLRAACEASLAALGVEQIGLYYLHAVDDSVGLEESVGALEELRREGKITAIGLCNVSIGEVERARRVAPISAVQNRLDPWSVGEGWSRAVDYCRGADIAFVAHSPLGGRSGLERLSASPELHRIAASMGVGVATLYTSAMVHAMPGLIAIPGATRRESVEGIARSKQMRLDDSQLRSIQRALAELPGRPPLSSRILSRIRYLLSR